MSQHQLQRSKTYSAACLILFISASEEDRLPAILGSVSALPILTVADMPLFAQAGGIIALKNVKGRIPATIRQLQTAVEYAPRFRAE